jgi:hypothetical protein
MAAVTQVAAPAPEAQKASMVGTLAADEGDCAARVVVALCRASTATSFFT